MSKIFISHSSVNNGAALALAEWLAEAGWDEYFLDVSPSRGLAPGERWQEALKAAADRCEAVLFLISPAWRDSRWCQAEFLLAKTLGKTIFGVLVEETPINTLRVEMTAEWQLCDLVTGAARQIFRVSYDPIVPETEISFAEDGLKRLKLGLQKAGLDPASFPWPPKNDPDRAPYRGLKALEPQEAAVFFGREASIVRGLDALRGLRERGVERLFVILGASGAGKSSFLRAGLWPRLLRDDRHFVPLPVIRPERSAISGVAGLTASLDIAFRERKTPKSRAAISQALQAPGGFASLLVELQTLARARLESDASPPTLVISVDQGEELFSTEGRTEAERFLDLLAQTLASPRGEGPEALALRQRALVVVAIRSDSYERLQTEPRLVHVAQHPFSLPPIPPAEFKAVIEGPAMRASEAGRKLKVDPALTEALVRDAEGADALPLLAFTLERLYVEYGGSGRLRREDYEALGGVRGSIEAAVEAAFIEPGRDPAIPADKSARELLLRAGFIPWLARIDPDTEERKRRVARLEEIPAEARPLLERLIEQRLLVRDRRRLVGGQEGIVVEVAHEALLRQWPSLSAWLDRDADALKVLGAVQRAADEWVKSREENGAGEAWLVHTGERLVDAEVLRRRPDFEQLLSANGQAYLDACRTRDERVRQEKEEQLKQAQALAEEQKLRANEKEKARRRTQILLILISLFAVAAGIFGFVSRREANTSLALQMAAQSGQKANKQLADALLLGVAAAQQQLIYETKDNLLRLFRLLPSGLRGYMWAHSGHVWSVAFSPDGKILATGSGDNTVILWDVANRKPLGEPLKAHSNSVLSVAFSPNGKILATGSGDYTVILWDVASRKPLGEPLKAHSNSVSSVAFSPDGKILATGSGDNTVILWDVANRNLLSEPLKAHSNGVLSVAFSPDGKILATSSLDNTAIFWDVTSHKLLGEPLKGHLNAVFSVAFSPDGKTFATGSHDNTAIFWDVASRKPLGEPLEAHSDSVLSVAFSPDGKILATGSGDNTAILWDVANRKRLGEPLKAHSSSVWSVAFSPDGKILATGSEDRTVTFWDVANHKSINEQLKAHSKSVRSVAFSPDGKTLATGSNDNTAILWDVANRNPLSEPLKAHSNGVLSVAFSPDGKILATGSLDRTVIFWDVASRKPIGKPVKRHSNFVLSVAFSPDGKILATGSHDRTAILWDVASRKPLGEPLKAHSNSVSSVAFSPDGKILATGGEDHYAILWDVASRKPLGEPLKAHSNSVLSVAFSPDGKILATGGKDNYAILWDVASRKPLGEPLKEHSSSVLSVAFSPDGKILATGWGDNAILWDVGSRKPVGEPLKTHSNSVSSVAFSPDGKILATGSYDNTVILWDIDMNVEKWIKRICEVVNRNFSKGEWRQYMGVRSYWKVCPKLPGPDDPNWPFASAGRE